MTVNTQNLNAKSVAKYVLLPGIIPRAKALATGGFGYLAYLFACVYRTVRILPPSHPYVNPANIGKFGIVKVIAAAANNVQLNRKNLDQVVVFIALLLAAVLLLLQFFLLVLAILSGQAFAAPPSTGYESIFLTQYPQLDIAFLMLDHVFGIPAPGGTFFGSNALGAGGPTPFHQGMHALFNFYNLALLLVGVLIFLYYVLVVVVETAQTGVPFGRRFSKIYAPLRLVIAIGMLVPLNYGFNAAQYITLYAAKLGSSFATNGWLTYNNAVRSNPMGVENSALVAKPRAPAIDEIAYFASVYHSCRTMYDIYARRVYLTGTGTVPPQGICIRPYVIVNGAARQLTNSPSESCGNAPGVAALDYIQAKQLLNGADMEIVLGERDPDKHSSFAGGVRPYCGRITISLNNNNPEGWGLSSVGGVTGVQRIEESYFNFVRDLLAGAPAAFRALGERAAYTHVPSVEEDHCHMSNQLGDASTCNADWTPGADVFSEPLATLRLTMEARLAAAYQEMGEGTDMRLPQDMARRGWGGAGIWYNQIADLNGTFTSAVYATPSVKNYPEIMEKVKKAREVQNKNNEVCNLFSPNLGDNIEVRFDADKDRDMAIAMNGAYEYFACDKKNQEMTPGAAVAAGGLETLPRIRRCGGVNPGTLEAEAIGMGGTARGQTANPFIDAIGLIFGINGLFDIRNASCIAEATGQPAIHPLAQLSTVGRSLVENAIRSMGMALGASFGGGLLAGSSFGKAAQAISGMLVSIATIGLTTGFILYYILPFLPFMYFFFAVGAWVKSIFEAMVGAPLWALAHLHIDGDGLPGRAAMTGYFLIFEIFLRPITIVLGLIGGMAVFGIMATVLNNIFDLVVLNATGAIPGESTAALSTGMLATFRRGVIDQLFFTIMYAIILYMIATASFKMIDTIPASFMRWIGSGVPTFNDNKGDPTQGLTQYAAIGGSQITGQVFKGMQSGAQGTGQGINAFLREMGGNDGNAGRGGPGG